MRISQIHRNIPNVKACESHGSMGAAHSFVREVKLTWQQALLILYGDEKEN